MQKSQPLLPASRNFFSLNRLKPDCYYPPVRVDFSSNPNPRTTVPSILPAFNHDLQFFTPAFLLPADKPYYQSNKANERHKFAQKMEAEEPKQSDDCEDKLQLEFEVKDGDSRYCQICQLKFEDYWKHVAEQSHTRRVHLSPSTAHIRELCCEFALIKDEHPPHAQPQPVEPKRRSRKCRNGDQQVEQSITSDMLKVLQGNFSTQILLEGSPMGQP